MATYQIKETAENNVVFNKNVLNKTLSSNINNLNYNSSISGIGVGNNILLKQNVSSTKVFKPNNYFISNYSYPFNTAIFFNYEIPYLGSNYTKKIQHLPEIYYTIPFDTENKTKFYQSNLNFKNNSSKKYRIHEGTDAALDFWTDIALDQSASDDFGAQNLQLQVNHNSDFITQNEQVIYYYYNSMNGTCPQCVLSGGNFGLESGVTYPNDDGPESNEQGYPLTGFTTCEALQEAIAAEPFVSGAEIILGYPILWEFTYKDGTYINGVGCETLPNDLQTAYAEVLSGLSEEKCSGLSESYPNIDINFEMFDTELIESTIKPSGPSGTPCSDLFGRIQ